MSLPAESRTPLVSFRNILFAMDFSPGSLLAFPFAANIADHYGGKIFAAHIVTREDYEALPNRREVVALELEASMEEALHGSRARLSDIPHEILFDHGSTSSRLLAAADKCKIDLIVIGTHGWHGIKKLLKGSTAEEIAGIATKPVLTVGPHVSRRFDFRVIVYATDFLPAATHALPYAISLAETYSASLLLLHVNDWDSRETPPQARPKTTQYFHGAAVITLSRGAPSRMPAVSLRAGSSAALRMISARRGPRFRLSATSYRLSHPSICERCARLALSCDITLSHCPAP